MPVVESYGPRRQTLRPLADTTNSVRPTPDAYGSGLGETIARAGLQGMAYANQIHDEELQKADQVRQLGWLNEFSTFKATRVEDPKTGALSVQGKDAVGIGDRVLADFDKLRGSIEPTLVGDRQKLAFLRDVQRERQQLQATLASHEVRQAQVYDEQETGDFLKNAASDALSNANDATRVQDAVLRGTAAIRDFSTRHGIGPEATTAKVSDFQTAVHTGVIKQLLTQGNDQSAQAYFDVVKSQIAGPALADVQRALETGATEGTAQRGADSIWQSFAPATDTDPVNLDRMEDAARTQFGDNPKVLHAVVQNLRERKAGVDAGRKEREDAVAGSLWQAAASGASLSALRKMPEYLAAPGRVQATISDYIVSRAERSASLAYTQESRAYTRAQRLESEREQKGWSAYWDLAQPDRLASMTDAQLNAQRPTLGDAHVNRLFDLKRRLDKPEAVREASIDADQFNAIAKSAGMNPYMPSPPETVKAQLGGLKAAVEDAIDVEQRRRGKPLTRDEKGKVMQSVVDQHVLVPGWFSSSSQIAATVRPGDRNSAYVPLAQVPARNVTEFANYIRSSTPTARSLSDQALVQQYQSRFEHAYAALLMRLGDQEVIARLEGR